MKGKSVVIDKCFEKNYSKCTRVSIPPIGCIPLHPFFSSELYV